MAPFSRLSKPPLWHRGEQTRPAKPHYHYPRTRPPPSGLMQFLSIHPHCISLSPPSLPPFILFSLFSPPVTSLACGRLLTRRKEEVHLGVLSSHSACRPPRLAPPEWCRVSDASPGHLSLTHGTGRRCGRNLGWGSGGSQGPPPRQRKELTG